MARLFADENFPLPVVVKLRRLGHEVLTIQEAGKADQSLADDDVLTLAASQNRAVLTLNRKHFIRLHGSRSEHAGIIVCTFDRDFAGQANRIHQALLLLGDVGKQLVRINRK
ncbi:MAG TPA: DUF5615 family PIN-like protein [Blastocatellia bacterium]|nr:DUF5615 family PIN-like protein [Blastocatellia bacterium]